MPSLLVHVFLLPFVVWPLSVACDRLFVLWTIVRYRDTLVIVFVVVAVTFISVCVCGGHGCATVYV